MLSHIYSVYWEHYATKESIMEQIKIDGMAVSMRMCISTGEIERRIQERVQKKRSRERPRKRWLDMRK